jgi:hypothetical protein
MDWPYGATLAFILVWFLSKVNETQVGVGIGRADYLVAAGFVFAASNLVQVAPFSDHLHSGSAAGVWVLIVGVALLGIAVARRDLTLTGLSLVIVVGGLFVGLLAHRYGNTYGNGQFVLPTNWAGEVTALLGAALAAIGLGFYVVERREA